jgi:hypothetical protein
MNKIIIFLFLLLVSCAPMPGNTLQEGVTHETPLDQMELVIHKGNYIDTSIACHKITWPIKPWLSLLSIPLNAGIVPACCEITYDGNGGIERCEVWYSHFDFLLQHELKHCMGYDEWP